MGIKKYLKKMQKKLYFGSNVGTFYERFADDHPGFAAENTLEATKYLIKLNSAERKGQPLESVPLPEKAERYSVLRKEKDSIHYYLDADVKREEKKDLVKYLSSYDVISFDIFDTAVYRKVEFPNDIFSIMSKKIGFNDFVTVRKKAEEDARREKELREGSREVTIHEIYRILKRDYNIDLSWEKREIELEIEDAFANPYIFDICRRLQEMGKTIIFISDMYLPLKTIKDILKKCGYVKYDDLFLSNDRGVSKGSGLLQKAVKEKYSTRSIIHIGDNYRNDVIKTKEAGIDAYYYPGPNLSFREKHIDGISGSLYRSIISTMLNNGDWNKSLHYEHGFRVGGVLAAGFCQYIEVIAEKYNIEKILFCSRDCSVIRDVYDRFYGRNESEYIQISRYAIMNAASERYLYDLYRRFVYRDIRKHYLNKTISDIFDEMGYGYLNDYLEESHIDAYAYPSAIGLTKIEEFFFSHRDVIMQKNRSRKKTAVRYFKEVLGNKKNVLIVDIGWSGTCITALKYLIHESISKDIAVHGVLLCSSKTASVSSSIDQGEIDTYINSPMLNNDITDYLMDDNIDPNEREIRHMALEYLFTSKEDSLIAYREEKGDIVFERASGIVNNFDEIEEMQKGIIDFNKIYSNNSKGFNEKISPYTAISPLLESVRHKDYLFNVYKNFSYDALTIPNKKSRYNETFSSFFPERLNRENASDDKKESGKKILFISPEMIYAGAPRSLLRMCKVAKSLNYDVTVWSADYGPFIAEYDKYNIPVEIVSEYELLNNRSIQESIRKFDLAICNTIVTDKYEKICSKYIPTVWYIREASNIPSFCYNNPERLAQIRASRNIYCVSDYAAAEIGKFTKQKIHVIHNCVEDESDLALDHVPGSSDTVKIAQFGAFEYRKGFDIIIAAYKSLPEEYKDKIELYFAGGYIRSGLAYCEYIFSEMDGEKNIHNLGLISDTKRRIEILSEMDAVIVASRDESCSLVALEGAMLSKPLIVTENVGAKYIVHEDNGLIVASDDTEQLADAMKFMVDHKDALAKMGTRSREYYEKQASMDLYEKDMAKLFSLAKKRNSISNRKSCAYARFVDHPLVLLLRKLYIKKDDLLLYPRKEKVIVSLTSHPGRIRTVSKCIDSILKQKTKPEKILLWLSEEQFSKKEQDLPEDLLRLQLKHKLFEIRWAKEDLGPHKKYFYTMQEYPDHPIIIIDDDAEYDDTMILKLMKSYKKHPHSISCMRANLITFNKDKTVKPYSLWIKDFDMFLDIPCWNLLPVGVGGVLLPPGCLPKEAFDVEAILKNCLYCDDLWLKAMEIYDGYDVVVPGERSFYQLIENSQESALWKLNDVLGNNNESFRRICDYCEETFDGPLFTERIRRDRNR